MSVSLSYPPIGAYDGMAGGGAGAAILGQRGRDGGGAGGAGLQRC